MESHDLLVSIYLTYTDVFGSVIGTRRVCYSVTYIDVIIVICAVTDDQVISIGLCQLTQVEGKP